MDTRHGQQQRFSLALFSCNLLTYPSAHPGSQAAKLPWVCFCALVPALSQPADKSVTKADSICSTGSTLFHETTTLPATLPSLLYLHMMADNAAAPPKPSSSVKLVLLGEAAVGKVRRNHGYFSSSFPASHLTSLPGIAMRSGTRWRG